MTRILSKHELELYNLAMNIVGEELEKKLRICYGKFSFWYYTQFRYTYALVFNAYDIAFMR